MNTVRFEEVDIHYVNDECKLWFCGRDICSALEYSNTNSNIGKVLSKVSSTNKKSLSELDTNTPHHAGLAVYIDEFGLLKFVLTSKKEKARDFERFLEMAINNLKYTALKSLQSANSNLAAQLAITEKSHEEMIKKHQSELQSLKSEHSSQLSMQDKIHKHQVDDAIATVLDESVASKRKRIRKIAAENHHLKEEVCRAHRLGGVSLEEYNQIRKTVMDYLRYNQQYRAQIEIIYELIDEHGCGCITSENVRRKAEQKRYC